MDKAVRTRSTIFRAGRLKFVENGKMSHGDARGFLSFKEALSSVFEVFHM